MHTIFSNKNQSNYSIDNEASYLVQKVRFFPCNKRTPKNHKWGSHRLVDAAAAASSSEQLAAAEQQLASSSKQQPRVQQPPAERQQRGRSSRKQRKIHQPNTVISCQFSAVKPSIALHRLLLVEAMPKKWVMLHQGSTAAGAARGRSSSFSAAWTRGALGCQIQQQPPL